MNDANVHASFEPETAQRLLKDETNLLWETVKDLDKRMTLLEEENVVLRASNEELRKEVAAISNSKIDNSSRNGQSAT
jgi:regulator of replication initiation timing